MNDFEKYKSVCFVLSLLVLLAVTTLVIHRRDTDRKIEKLEIQSQRLSKQVIKLQDDMLETEKRITRVESQFWE
jgi:membrane protein implicated in regulation of membrane protease activity